MAKPVIVVVDDEKGNRPNHPGAGRGAVHLDWRTALAAESAGADQGRSRRRVSGLCS